MDEKKTVIRNIIIYTIGIFIMIHDYIMTDINIKTEQHLTYVAVLYIILFAAFIDFFELIKNKKKYIINRIEYYRLFFALIYTLTFMYNIFIV